MDEMSVGRTIYKRGSKGEVRVWYMEQDGDQHRTIAGVKDGKLTTSGWTTCEAKNVGKKNERSAEEQAASEIENSYKKKLKSGYFEDEADIDTLAYIKPMLATKYKDRVGKLDPNETLYIQPKLEGIRCIARAIGLWTRTGEPITSCNHLVVALQPLFDANPELVLDGELYNHALKDDFNTIGSLVRKKKPTKDDITEIESMIEYHIYDMVSDASFEDRCVELIALLGMDGFGPIKRVDTKKCMTSGAADDWYEIWLKDGYEGQMVRINGPYQINKRSTLLMKRKEFETEEYEVVHMVEGNGNWAGCARKFVCRLPDGREFGADVVGTQAQLKKLWDSGKTPDWATVERFAMLTPDGIPRFGKAKDWGTGKRKD